MRRDTGIGVPRLGCAGAAWCRGCVVSGSRIPSGGPAARGWLRGCAGEPRERLWDPGEREGVVPGERA